MTKTKDEWHKLGTPDSYLGNNRVVCLTDGNKVFLGELWGYSQLSDSHKLRWQEVVLPEPPKSKLYQHKHENFTCMEVEEEGKVKLMLRYKRANKLAYVEVVCCPFTGYKRG